MKLTVEKRYWAKVDVKGPNECWPWLAGCDGNGYGTFRDSKMQRAHRWAYIHYVGPIGVGLCVCHSCDNPPCQNPNHWFLGTHLENIADRTAKGRSYRPTYIGYRRAQGEDHADAKITEAQARDIRLRYVAGKNQSNRGNAGVLALEYGISSSQVRKIAANKAWKHLDRDNLVPAL